MSKSETLHYTVVPLWLSSSQARALPTKSTDSAPALVHQHVPHSVSQDHALPFVWHRAVNASMDLHVLTTEHASDLKIADKVWIVAMQCYADFQNASGRHVWKVHFLIPSSSVCVCVYVKKISRRGSRFVSSWFSLCWPPPRGGLGLLVRVVPGY